MANSSWIGKIIGGRYKIEELLGQGGMSAVYKATDPNLRRVVAIKMIHSHLSTDPGFLRRFEEEAAAVAQLRHPNIVQVYDFHHDGDTYYMVLEFVPGETLQDHLRRLNSVNRHLATNDVIQYSAGICDAVDYAHQRGLIHRDIKPANIMLSVMGQAILMDFGIAKIVGGQQHTATGAVVGTAMYMSPEQIKGENPDRRTDIYSLGVTLFEMVSGHPPFDADSAMTLMMMHINDPVPDLRKLNPDVPHDLVAVINKALAKNPADRFQTAAQMAAALREIQEKVTRSRLADALEGATFVEKTEEPSPRQNVYDQPEKAGIEGTLVDAGTTPPRTTTPPPRPSRVESRPAEPVRGIPPPPQAPRTAAPAAGARARPTLLIAGVVGLLALICLFAGGALAYNQFFAGGGNGAPTAALTPATQVAANLAPTDTQVPTDTVSVAGVATATTAPPTQTSAPVNTPTITLTPTATVPVGIPFARINAITIDGDRYVADYETFEFTERISSDTLHVHFFFDTVPPDQAGVPGSGPWILYGGPRPFTGYRVSDRPGAATQMCILVANPNHSVQPNSGNCLALPDVASPQGSVSDAPAADQNQPESTDVVSVDSHGAAMVLIEAGEFTMGSDDRGSDDERPAHPVTLDDFLIDRYEVTNGQYRECVVSGECKQPREPGSFTRAHYFEDEQFDNYPVIYVSWNDAITFCEWREARLPTEAEWEKAGRGTDGRNYPWGEDISCDLTNYANCLGDTAESGAHPADLSPYGVYDLAGNVRELVDDWYNAYPGGDPDFSDNYGETHKVVRGGSYDSDASAARTTNRAVFTPENLNHRVGFRCARAP
jgi:serine/threonine protein kinase/formylglycine-generating enzyme required for sulfatase activity